MYKRILLKLSGEQLQADQPGGIDAERVKWIAHQVRSVVNAGTEVVIMVGGGNYARGAQLAGNGIGAVTAHNTGMLATIMNSIVVSDIFNEQRVATVALSSVEVNQFVDQYTHRRAEHHLSKGRVVIIGGGIGRPFLTTDTAAVNLALEMDCDVVIKTTKVDGVYNADPNVDPSARKFDRLSYQQALSNPNIAVMDKAAIGLAMDENKPVIICDLLTDGNIARAAGGEQIGTLITV